MIRRFMCWLGMHGPDWCGYLPHPASHGGPFVRSCGYCGERWVGYETTAGYGVNEYRTVGWARDKSARAAIARAEGKS